MSRVVVVLFAFAFAGCARTHLFYDTRELRHEPIEGKQRLLQQAVADKINGRNVVWVDQNGREQIVDAAGLRKLGQAELGALWLATSVGENGAENDLRVRVNKRQSI